MLWVALLAGLVAGGLVAVVAIRLISAHVQRQSAAEREVTVRRAVEAAVTVAGAQLTQQSAAGARELHLHRQAIGEQLSGVGDELRRVTDIVTALQRERAEQHGVVVRGLDEAMRATARLADTAQSLKQALASPKARGQWGERMADDVLRVAGMIDGLNYRKQTAIAGGTVPDFTFLLPRGRLLHMDVKFPIDNYLRYLEAGTDAERARLREAFLRDVRHRVRELAGRGYADPATTVGYHLLFIPNEGVYAFMCEHVPDLAEEALGQKVVLCSPFTLFAVLGVIRQAVDNFLLERTSDEILEALAAFSAQWQKFTEQLDVVGRRMASVQSAYDDLSGPRRRQLQRRLDEVDNLRRRRPGLDVVEPGDGEGGVRALPSVSSL
jgi:DNA recombination protein RmuC